MSKGGNVAHLLAIVLFMMAATSAFVNEVFYSKEAIMAHMDMALAIIGKSIPPVDQLFIARVLRRELWSWHFYFGAALFLVLTILAIESKKVRIVWLYMLFGLTMFVTGFALFIRDYVAFSQGFLDVMRTIHYWSAWVFFALFLLHALYAILYAKPENIAKRFSLR